MHDQRWSIDNNIVIFQTILCSFWQLIRTYEQHGYFVLDAAGVCDKNWEMRWFPISSNFFCFPSVWWNCRRCVKAFLSQYIVILHQFNFHISVSHLGTEITILGLSFMTMGLMSPVSVYIGSNICELPKHCVQNQCTTNERIVCITPPCKSCKHGTLYDSTNSNGWVDITVVVKSSSGNQYAKSSFYYSVESTPAIEWLGTPYTYATSVNFVGWRPNQGSAPPGNTAVRIDNLLCNVDEITGKLNTPATRDVWNPIFYFRPPSEVTAGFYNISSTIQNYSVNGMAMVYDRYTNGRNYHIFSRTLTTVFSQAGE